MTDIDISQTYVVDTFAWYEYFIGSEIGADIRNLIEKGKHLTPSIVVAELVNKFTREKKPYSEFIRFLKLKSEVVMLDSEIAEIAGNLRAQFNKKSKNKIGMGDAIVMAVAEIRNLKTVTGDEHFRGLKNVVMIK